MRRMLVSKAAQYTVATAPDKTEWGKHLGEPPIVIYDESKQITASYLELLVHKI